MSVKGILSKMRTQLNDGQIAYELPVGDNLLALNPMLGKKIKLNFTGNIHCLHCNKAIKKTYFQGYCYQCFSSLPQTDVGVLHPEKDLSYIGISRDMDWSEKNSLTPHYVYLSLTDKVKVGVTRCSQIPTRWIDQGAIQAIVLAKTPNRHIAGIIEVFLKKYFADKTSWQQMLLQKEIPQCSLLEEKLKAISLLHDELKQYVVKENEVVELAFPILKIPVEVNSIRLEVDSEINSVLVGIKGQYLIFEDNKVLNVRNYGGYEVILTEEE